MGGIVEEKRNIESVYANNNLVFAVWMFNSRLDDETQISNGIAVQRSSCNNHTEKQPEINPAQI